MLGAAFSTAIGNVTAYEQEQQRADELARIARAKTAFFSNGSHEFRTPRTLILGPLDDALTSDGLAPPQRRQLETTHRNARRLLKLVNSLLDFSRIEAGRVQATYQAVDLARLTTDIACVFEPAMEKGGLAYMLDLPPLLHPVHVDRDMWEKIVLNLLSNAFKFTLRGAVKVALREHEGMARLSVRDTGSGIAEAELARVFERFHRVESVSGRSLEGSGIGLALIQELVWLHGGSITAQSIVGQGTEFVVNIPLGKAHLPADRIVAEEADQPRIGAAFLEEALGWLPDAESTRAVPALRTTGSPLQPETLRARILIADDNSDMRNYLKSLLEPHADVRVCGDGETAFAQLMADAPDMLISDVMMPELDGFSLLARIRANSTLHHIPVMLLSARAGDEAKVEGLQAGADDYLVKPFSSSELIARVRRQVELARERQRQEAAAAERDAYVRSLIDTSPAVLWTSDERGQCTYRSQRWYQFTGRTPEQELGLGWLDNIHHEDIQRCKEIFLQAHVARSPFSIDYRLRQHDDAYRWVVDAGMPHEDAAGAPNGYVGTVIDIHDRILLQDDQQRLTGELEEKNRQQREFLFTLAHELRNPLAPIRAGLEVMRTNPSALTAANIQSVMRRQVDHMVHLVDDLLDIGRLTEGKIILQRADVLLVDVMNDALDMSRPLLDAAHHQVRVDLPQHPIMLYIDRNRITQVLSNLLNNAAKYTPADGCIDVVAMIEDSMLIITVTDNGIGIDAELLPTVFNMYTQALGGDSLMQGGLGVGLNLVRRLVKLHDGQVSAYSDGAGRGSCFKVCLPLLFEQTLKAPFAGMLVEVPQSVPRTLRILVVDDNMDAANMLATLLEFSGHLVAVAHDGAATIAAVANTPPEVVILDIGLPDISGYDLALTLRELPSMGHVKFIALTGWGAESDKQKATEAGFNYHVTKPADFALLKTMLDGIATQMQ